MIKEVFRILGRFNKEGLSESNWRDLVDKKIKEAEGKKLYPRFFNSNNKGWIYSADNEYRFDIEFGQESNLIVIFIEREGVKINSVLGGIEQGVREAVILEKDKPPRYAYCQDIRWQMLQEGKDNNGLLLSAFSAMRKSVLFDSRKSLEITKTSWGCAMADMPGIRNLLLQESTASAAITIGYSQAV